MNKCRCLSIDAHAEVNFSLQNVEMQSGVSYRKLYKNECVNNIEGLRILLVFCRNLNVR